MTQKIKIDQALLTISIEYRLQEKEGEKERFPGTHQKEFKLHHNRRMPIRGSIVGHHSADSVPAFPKSCRCRGCFYHVHRRDPLPIENDKNNILNWKWDKTNEAYHSKNKMEDFIMMKQRLLPWPLCHLPHYLQNHELLFWIQEQPEDLGFFHCKSRTSASSFQAYS